MNQRTDYGCEICFADLDEHTRPCYYCAQMMCPQCLDRHQEEQWPCRNAKFVVIDGGKA